MLLEKLGFYLFFRIKNTKRSNFMGTEFKIYDNGLNPKKCHQWDKVRAEIGAVIYVQKKNP